MQYHAHALAVNGAEVDLIGEAGTPLPAFLEHPRVRVHRLPPRRPAASHPLAFLARAALASLRSALELFARLLRVPRPDVILVQTPPAIPSLAMAWLAARLRGARVVIDWHNLGWTLLALRWNARHPLVRVARGLERLSAPLGDAHLAVSAALAAHLESNWRLRPVYVCRDRPSDAFSPERADVQLRERLAREAGFDAAGPRPAFVISPTSWTRDEDMELLIEAADRLEARWSQAPASVRLLVVATGQGAGRQAFEARLAARAANRVRVITAWMAPDDYPRLVAAADAGVCLHRSSSGLDVPMKAYDMLGAGIPPCLLDYGPAVREGVEPDVNALLFRDAGELAGVLDVLFSTWPAPSPLWQQLREGARRAAAGPRWTAAWKSAALPALAGS